MDGEQMIPSSVSNVERQDYTRHGMVRRRVSDMLTSHSIEYHFYLI